MLPRCGNSPEARTNDPTVPTGAVFAGIDRAWTGVIWRCWQDHTTYDATRHGALNRYLSQDAAAAA